MTEKELQLRLKRLRGVLRINSHAARALVKKYLQATKAKGATALTRSLEIYTGFGFYRRNLENWVRYQTEALHPANYDIVLRFMASDHFMSIVPEVLNFLDHHDRLVVAVADYRARCLSYVSPVMAYEYEALDAIEGYWNGKESRNWFHIKRYGAEPFSLVHFCDGITVFSGFAIWIGNRHFLMRAWPREGGDPLELDVWSYLGAKGVGYEPWMSVNAARVVDRNIRNDFLQRMAMRSLQFSRRGEQLESLEREFFDNISLSVVPHECY